ncbi:hypothetical protein K402DRAFT_416636 [Aulographum hederae CBS 113979]|uniref:Uncharacterized protein n=1 Tax=Aulographum hederae CBS 113979 TaxID=1176131 RepID=A0A6G1HDK2_9PEZI|nr:hypothetical protein K402DRAFT_416636 [Aulographum hederae CBS 113979]
MNAGNSAAYTNIEQQALRELHRLQGLMQRRFPGSDVHSWNAKDVLKHVRAIAKAEHERRDRIKLDMLNEQHRNKILMQAGETPIPRTRGVFGQRPLCNNNGLGAVLSEKTVWCPWVDVSKPVAGWPGQQEMAWEGDERAKTKVGRMMPIPRVPGNGTIAWHKMNAIDANKFDHFPKVPTGEDIYAPTEEIEEDVVPGLLNSSILEAIDSDEIK